MITKSEHAKIEAQIKALLSDLETQDKVSEGDQAVVTLDQQSVGRLNRMDALQRQAMAQATKRRRQMQKAALKAALQRLEDGEFGYCLECGEEIAAARLKNNPAVPHCFDCASQAG